MLAARPAPVDASARPWIHPGARVAAVSLAWAAVMPLGGCDDAADLTPGEPVYAAAEAWARGGGTRTAGFTEGAGDAGVGGDAAADGAEVPAMLGPTAALGHTRRAAAPSGDASSAVPWRPGEWITVRGVARSSGFDLRREFFVLLDVGVPLVGVECFIDARDLGPVRAVPTGEPLTIRGRVRDSDANLVLEACRLR